MHAYIGKISLGGHAKQVEGAGGGGVSATARCTSSLNQVQLLPPEEHVHVLLVHAWLVVHAWAVAK